MTPALLPSPFLAGVIGVGLGCPCSSGLGALGALES